MFDQYPILVVGVGDVICGGIDPPTFGVQRTPVLGGGGVGQMARGPVLYKQSCIDGKLVFSFFHQYGN